MSIVVLSVVCECRFRVSRVINCYAECYFSECHYAKCPYANVIMLNVLMLNVLMLNILMLNILMLNVVMLNADTQNVLGPFKPQEAVVRLLELWT